MAASISRLIHDCAFAGAVAVMEQLENSEIPKTHKVVYDLLCSILEVYQAKATRERVRLGTESLQMKGE